MKTKTDMTVADNLCDQLGGMTFRLLGAYHLVGDDKGLTFKFRGSRKANCVRIKLNALDLYDVEFLRYLPKKFELHDVSAHQNVPVDALHDLIENVTGLYTRI